MCRFCLLLYHWSRALLDRLLIVRVRVIVIVIAVVLGIVLQEPPGCSQPASKHQVCKHRCLWTITITVTIAITITIRISIDAALAVAVVDSACCCSTVSRALLDRLR